MKSNETVKQVVHKVATYKGKNYVYMDNPWAVIAQ
jgi:hypothetical protein